MRYLFDRICSPGGGRSEDRPPSEASVRASVALELERIVSQRSYFYGIDHYLGSSSQDLPGGVLDYGLASLSDADGNNHSISRVAAEIQKAILMHEPRIHDPRVEIKSTGRASTSAQLLITGKLLVESKSIDFDTQLSAFG